MLELVGKEFKVRWQKRDRVVTNRFWYMTLHSSLYTLLPSLLHIYRSLEISNFSLKLSGSIDSPVSSLTIFNFGHTYPSSPLNHSKKSSLNHSTVPPNSHNCSEPTRLSSLSSLITFKSCLTPSLKSSESSTFRTNLRIFALVSSLPPLSGHTIRVRKYRARDSRPYSFERWHSKKL